MEANRPRLRIGAVVAVALAAGLAAWLATADGGSKHAAPPSTGPGGPALGSGRTVPVTPQGLRTLAGVLTQPIFWAGAKPGYRLELTREDDGRVFVRYLPPGVKVGARKPLVTIGTYPLPNAYDSTLSVASRSDSVRLPLSNGVAFYSRTAPTSIYLAYRGSNVQVEIFDPWAPGARRLFHSGAVQPVPGKSPSQGLSTEPQGLTLTGLKAFAQKVGHPVYWVGAKPGTTYEVTQTTNGQIFVRYLPPRVGVGTRTPYLTVGTYPVQSALDVTRKLAAKAGSVSVAVTGGAVAFYASSRPTNIYEAFPGSDYQAEIYDPSVSEARQFVASGRVSPVG